MALCDEIANTIQKADSSYFFENYTKQAAAVISMLESKGYLIVPKKPTEEMISAGENGIRSGKVKPAEHVQHVYTTMALAGAKK